MRLAGHDDSAFADVAANAAISSVASIAACLDIEVPPIVAPDETGHDENSLRTPDCAIPDANCASFPVLWQAGVDAESHLLQRVSIMMVHLDAWMRGCVDARFTIAFATDGAHRRVG
jgi:hypothetical protein